MAEITASTKKERKVSREELELLYKGIRPEWMDMNKFKSYRKALQKAQKGYLKGTYVSLGGRPVTRRQK